METLYSHHIFIFPFKWQHSEVGSENDLSLRFNLKNLRENKLPLNWKRKDYRLDGYEQYNEFNYFYGHVREILYDLGEDLSNDINHGNKELINHFEYQWERKENWHYCIKLNDRDDTVGNHYFLKIDSILLNVYSTGTAIISFHLKNFRHESENDVLLINQFGRRLYPPFFGLDKDTVFTGEKNNISGENALNYVKNTELADCIWIGSPEEENKKKNNLYEDFKAYQNPDFFRHDPFAIPGFIAGLFQGKNWSSNIKSSIQNEGHFDKGVLISPTLDDRMFVVCWYANDALIGYLQKYNNRESDQSSSLLEKGEDWFYRFVFVDGDSVTCQDKAMKETLLKASTYTRWNDWGTVFGISRYSLVMLTSKTVPPFLIRHLQTMYYKMAELCLVQRATVLNYADEVTHVSHLLLDNQMKDQTLEKIALLYKKYLVFINKIYFKEITAQEQGIEMYDMLQANMRLREDVLALDKQIEELHVYADIEATKINNKLLTKIAVIGAVFLPLSLMASIMDFNVLPGDFLNGFGSFRPDPDFWSRIGVVILFSLSVILLLDGLSKFQFYKEKAHIKFYRILIYGLFFIIGVILTFLHSFY